MYIYREREEEGMGGHQRVISSGRTTKQRKYDTKHRIVLKTERDEAWSKNRGWEDGGVVRKV